MAKPTISREDKRACVARELALRRSVYQGLVRRGRMTQADADHEIAAMAAVLDDYRDPPGPDLFTQPGRPS